MSCVMLCHCQCAVTSVVHSVLWRREVKSRLASPTDRPPCPLCSLIPTLPCLSLCVSESCLLSGTLSSVSSLDPRRAPRPRRAARRPPRARRGRERETHTSHARETESQTDPAQNIKYFLVHWRGARARPTQTPQRPKTHEHAHDHLCSSHPPRPPPSHHSDALLTELLLARVVELPPG